MRRRGFRLGRRLVRVFRWVFRSKRRSCTSYQRLDDFSSSSCSRRSYRTKTMTKIYSWGQYLKRGAKELCCAGYSRPAPLDYCRLGGGSGSGTGSGGRPFYEELKPVEVPKGHLAVYVGKKDDDPQPHRVLVPIIYFNHPLFGELLREAEKEFGYNHPGGITLPCPISEFEKVKTEIAAGRKLSSTTRRHQD